MTTLELFFLGPLEIHSDGQPLPNPPTIKSQSLLAYLVYQRSQPQTRDRLAGLFWGELPERKAHRCLSTALWHIRRCLPDDSVLLNDSHSVQFDPQGSFWLDQQAFEAQAVRTDPASLQAALALYRGDFLDGFYDDWIFNERYRLEAVFLDALARLMVLYEAGGDYQAALATALRLLDRDPLREDAYRLAMRAFCRLGQRKAALEQYYRCRQTLLDELNTQPMDETNALYQAILEGRFKIGPMPEISQVRTPPVSLAGRSPLDLTAPVRLIGREREMAFLEGCWQQARAGSSILALIAGEVGVGKTCLVEEFARQLRWHGSRLLWGRCYEFERLLPYQPIAEALQTSLPTFPKLDRASFPEWVLREVDRLAPEALGLPVANVGYPTKRRKAVGDPEPELAVAPGVDPQQARLFEGVTRVLAELSIHEVLLFVLEDLHWASQSTLQMLHYLVRHLAGNPVLFLGTFRPEDVSRQHPLPELHHQLARAGLAQQLELPRLNPDAVTTLIQEMSGAGEAVNPLARRLYRETEGNPFFLMESIKALFETGVIQLKAGAWQGDFSLASEAKPPLTASLSEAVQGRVRRLGENTQAALGLAAVLGREFDFELFNEAWGSGEEATLEALDELLRHRLVEEQFDPDERDYRFTHHKIQEVVYQNLSSQRRFHWHARAGASIEILYSAELETRAGELAYHFEQAARQDKTLSNKAISYLMQAGEQAVRQSANQEAVAYYQRGLDILSSLPETEGRTGQEIKLLMSLAVPVSTIKGYASPELKLTFDRAYALCQKLSDTPDLFTSLVGIARYYGLTGDHETSGNLAEQLLTIARTTQENDLLLEACRQMGAHSFSLGRLTEARQFWEQGLDLYDRTRHECTANRFGHDPAVTCLGFLSMTLWLLGYPEQSLAQSAKLSSLISTLTHPSSQAYARCLLAKQACMHHAAQAAYEHAQAAIQVSRLHGLTSWTILATALKGWAQFEGGQLTEGLALMEEGIQAFQARGFAHFIPFLLGLQAEACLKVQKVNEGLSAVTAALGMGQQGGDRYWMAELHRLHGELLRASGADDRSVEAHFQQALETARGQGARMFELRAAVSLTRLHQKNSLSAAARQALVEVYDCFSEGFDTCDLQEANDLLAKGVINVT